MHTDRFARNRSSPNLSSALTFPHLPIYVLLGPKLSADCWPSHLAGLVWSTFPAKSDVLTGCRIPPTRDAHRLRVPQEPIRDALQPLTNGCANVASAHAPWVCRE